MEVHHLFHDKTSNCEKADNAFCNSHSNRILITKMSGIIRGKVKFSENFTWKTGQLREKPHPPAVFSQGCTNAIKFVSIVGLLQLQTAEIVHWQISFESLCFQFKLNKQIDFRTFYSSLLKTIKSKAKRRGFLKYAEVFYLCTIFSSYLLSKLIRTS